MAQPQLNDPIVDFSAEGNDGKTHRLSDYAGKPVVVYFYPKDNTPGCTTEACDFRDNMERLTEHGAVVFGVSRDSIKSHQGFVDKHNLNFVLLSDPDLTVHKVFGALKEDDKTQRSTFLIAPDGTLAKSWPQVSVKGHVDHVIEAVESL